MAELLDYRFGETEQTIADVTKELGEFRKTLNDFRDRYTKLAQAWGGTASEGAAAEASKINEFGNETAQIVKTFVDRLSGHLILARTTETRITNLYT